MKNITKPLNHKDDPIFSTMTFIIRGIVLTKNCLHNLKITKKKKVRCQVIEKNLLSGILTF